MSSELRALAILPYDGVSAMPAALSSSPAADDDPWTAGGTLMSDRLEDDVAIDDEIELASGAEDLHGGRLVTSLES